MSLKLTSHFYTAQQSFNMTPVIDIVFQLIIFFSLVCRFIEAENFPVIVPDNCNFSRPAFEPAADQLTTVTVMKTSDEKITFAVGAEKISAQSYPEIVHELSNLIDLNLKDLPPQRRVISVRIDKDVPFDQAQYALAAIAASSATDIQLATLKDKRTD